MVIGATGSIGSVSARLLAMAFDEVVSGRPPRRSWTNLQGLDPQDTPDAKVFTTTSYDDVLGDMDMIVTATSGAGKSVLDITKVKPGCVITDVARPARPSARGAKRPTSGDRIGRDRTADKVHGMKSIGLPNNVIYACLAETIVLALEGRFEVFTIGRDTEWEKVKEIYKLGLKHGMKLAAISGVKGVYTDKDIARVVALAKKARLTWKGAGAGRPAAKAAPAGRQIPRATARATLAAKAVTPLKCAGPERRRRPGKAAAVKRTPTTRAPKAAARRRRATPE